MPDAKPYGPRWTTALEEQAYDLSKQGMSDSQIATLLGIRRETVCRRRKRFQNKIRDWQKTLAGDSNSTTLKLLRAPLKREVEKLITLDQAAALVSKSKITFKKRKGIDLPKPTVKGGGGRPDLWLWRDIRPFLLKYHPNLPEQLS